MTGRAAGEIPSTRDFGADWSAGGGRENQFPGDLPFRSEQCLGCLTRSDDPLAVVAPRVWS